MTEVSAEDIAQREAERLEKISSLEHDISELESGIKGIQDISLIGVQVSSEQYGIGTIIAQNINMVTVRFIDCEKSFKLDKKYRNRSTFEDDEEIIEAFTKYGSVKEQIEKLQKRIDALL